MIAVNLPWPRNGQPECGTRLALSGASLPSLMYDIARLSRHLLTQRPSSCSRFLYRMASFFRRQALQTQDPGDRPVHRHVRRPVGAKDHPIDPDRIDQQTQGGFAMRQTIIVELAEIGAGAAGGAPRLGTYLPAPVHAADAEAGM